MARKRNNEGFDVSASTVPQSQGRYIVTMRDSDDRIVASRLACCATPEVNRTNAGEHARTLASESPADCSLRIVCADSGRTIAKYGRTAGVWAHVGGATISGITGGATIRPPAPAPVVVAPTTSGTVAKPTWAPVPGASLIDSLLSA